MKVLTINASDYTAGGAAGIAVQLHKYAHARNPKSKMLVGKKTSDIESVHQIRRPLYTKVLSYALSNDIDFFHTNYLLNSKEFLEADIVHYHNVAGWYFNLATLVKMSQIKPTIWTLHDMWALTPHCGHTSSEETRNGLFKCSDQSLYPTTCWNNDLYLSYRKNRLYKRGRFGIVTPCEWLFDKLKRTCLSSKAYSVVPNGIDTEVFIPQDRVHAKNKIGIGSKRVVIFVASDPVNNIYKGFEDFVWLAEQFPNPDTLFLAVGAPCDGWHGKVKLIKATQDKKKIAAYLGCADLLVLTSRHEVFPLVVLEALAVGLPVVAYDVGGVKEAIAGLPGCDLVLPQNRRGLMDAAVKSLNHTSQDYLKVGAELRKVAVDLYSLEKMKNSYLKIYQSFIESYRGLC